MTESKSFRPLTDDDHRRSYRALATAHNTVARRVAILFLWNIALTAWLVLK